jgi:hypothetical protein
MIKIITDLNKNPNFKKWLKGSRESHKKYYPDRDNPEHFQNLSDFKRISLRKLPLNNLDIGTDVKFYVPEIIYSFIKKDFLGIWVKYNDSIFAGDYYKARVMQTRKGKQFHFFCSRHKSNPKKKFDLFEQFKKWN